MMYKEATSKGRPFGSEGFIKKLENMLGRDIFLKKGERPKKEEILK